MVESKRFQKKTNKNPLTDIWYIHKGFENRMTQKSPTYPDVKKNLRSRLLNLKRRARSSKHSPIKLSPRLERLSVSAFTKRKLVSNLATSMLKNIKNEHLCDIQINEIQKYTEFNKVKELVGRHKISLRKTINADINSNLSFADSENMTNFGGVINTKEIMREKTVISQELNKIINNRSKSKFHKVSVNVKRPNTLDAYKGLRGHRHSVT
mmetsp:Transcript_33067/g.29305  ORF Transcript_33067/g.29305 Transcript_33067/m.29305 type:complete len:210 (+) Transcript_33067:936-1565(+)